MNSSYQPYSPQRPPQKKKRHFKPNKEGITALLILVLVVALVITLLVLTIKAIVRASRPDETTESTPEVISTTEETTVAPVATWHDDYLKESISSDKIEEGALVLVNFEHNYAPADFISSKLTALYGTAGYQNGTYALKDSSIKLRRDIVTPLTQMLTDLIGASNGSLGTSKTDDRVIVSGGHRSTDYQRSLYEKAVADNFVAEPGFSEHHTGYAIDLKVFTSAGKTVDFRDNEFSWLLENSWRYGFVNRYDGAKFEITGILNESWHFRYVGVPHAAFMFENDLCLEEYLNLLRTEHAYQTDEPLEWEVEGTSYLAYYFPVPTGSSTCFVPVPPKSVGTYEISGDNQSGFIVTVTKSK